MKTINPREHTWVDEFLGRLDSDLVTAIYMMTGENPFIRYHPRNTRVGRVAIQESRLSGYCDVIFKEHSFLAWRYIAEFLPPDVDIEIWGSIDGKRRRLFSVLKYGDVPQHFKIQPSLVITSQERYKKDAPHFFCIDEACDRVGVPTLGEVLLQQPAVLANLGINRDDKVITYLLENLHLFGLRFGMTERELSEHPGIFSARPSLPETCGDENVLARSIKSLDILGLFSEAQNIERLISQGKIAEAWQAAEQIKQFMNVFQSALAATFTER